MSDMINLLGTIVHCHNYTSRCKNGDMLANDIRAMKKEVENIRAALSELMPFVLEEYYPNCATEPYKKAVERAKSLISVPNALVRRPPLEAAKKDT